MSTMEHAKTASDSLYMAAKYYLELEASRNQNEFYVWALGITALIIIGLISFIAYSWKDRISDLTIAIRDLSKNLIATTNKLEVSMAEEVAHRGYCIEKHKQHTDDIKGLRSDVDHVTGRVDMLEADHKRIHANNSTI